jgi:hypothetical protein
MAEVYLASPIEKNGATRAGALLRGLISGWRTHDKSQPSRTI